MEAKQLDRLTLAEYVSLEQETDTKYEFHNGRVYALAEGTLVHATICGNIFGELWSKLKKKDGNYKARNSEIKVYIKSENAVVYSDAMVICGDIEESDEEINAITNPILIVEVLSKSTENYDRGDKFYKYRQIESLQEYVLIDQNKPQVEVFQKRSDLWKITRIQGLESSITLNSIDVEVKLKDICQDVTFEEV